MPPRAESPVADADAAYAAAATGGRGRPLRCVRGRTVVSAAWPAVALGGGLAPAFAALAGRGTGAGWIDALQLASAAAAGVAAVRHGTRLEAGVTAALALVGSGLLADLVGRLA